MLVLSYSDLPCMKELGGRKKTSINNMNWKCPHREITG
jgi:hypothetical protein